MYESDELEPVPRRGDLEVRFSLTPEQHASLKDHADRSERSIAAQARFIVKLWLERNNP